MALGLAFGTTTSPGRRATPTADLAVAEVAVAEVAVATTYPADVQQQLDALEGEFGPRLRDCAAQWDKVRADVRSSGGSDSEARRAADIARASCEDPLLAELYSRVEAITRSVQPPATPCVGEPALHPAQTATLDAQVAGSHNLFVTCSGEDRPIDPLSANGLTWPVRDAGTVATAGMTVEEAIRSVFQAYSASTIQYAERPMGAFGVTFANGVLTIALPEDVKALSLGASSQIERFLSEVTANAFQFNEVAVVVLELDAQCEQFWALTPYGTCPSITRDGVTVKDG